MTLYRIEQPGPGGLAIVSRPQLFAGATDVADWKAAGVTHAVSLVEDHEILALGLEKEAEACAEQGITFERFPIADRGLPESMTRLNDLAERAQAIIKAGGSVAVHCRAGIGRSGLTSASILVAAGMLADEAFERIAAARGVPVPDTEAQRAWVGEFAAYRRDAVSAASVFRA
ncbi:MAG: tyrosine protein phosphatase [Caulobacter sp.]|nr:tyrosine protein phosphatase [Caulobacter sp.]